MIAHKQVNFQERKKIMITQEMQIEAQNCVDANQYTKFLRCNHIGSQQKIDLPMVMLNTLEDKLLKLSPIRALAKITHTSGDRLDVVVDAKESEVSGWIADELITVHDKSNITKVSIYLHQLFSKPRVTQTLLEDETSNVEEFVNERITTQMASAENKSFLFGDGITQPKGILTYEISVEGPREHTIEGVIGGKPGEINPSKLVELMERMPTKYLSGAVWLMSRNAASYIRTIKDETNGKFLWQNSIVHGTPDTLLGYPVVITDDMPKINTTDPQCVPILFANLYEGYQIAEKPNITILKDPFNAKPYIEFYATKRIGGDVVNFNAIKALVLRK